MKKVFLSYPFTGENLENLAITLSGIVIKLKEYGFDTFCALLQKKEIDDLGIIGYDNRLAYCLEQQKDAEMVVAVILSEVPSNGMFQELQRAKQLKQEYFLFIKKGLTFNEFREYANQVVEYSETMEIPTLIETMLANQNESAPLFSFSE